MRRRHVLAGTLGLVSGGLAGCIANVGSDGAASTSEQTTTAESPETTSTADESGDPDDPDDSDGSGDPGETDEDGTMEPQTGPAVTETSFRQTGGGCGDGVDEASVTVDDGRVTVTGTISGRDACMRPRLASASLDAAGEELVVLVETFSEGEMCSQCIVDLGYEATVRLDGGRPAGVVVRHESRGEVRTAARAAT